jgi:hypothetical protein
MLFASGITTHTHKNGALRALFALNFKIKMSQYFIFCLLAFGFWPGCWLPAAG